MMDGNDTDGFPQGENGVSQFEERLGPPIASGDQGLVADHIFPLQPVTALVYVVAPAPYPIDVTLIGLKPNTVETQTAIAAALADILLATGEPGGFVYPSQLYDAILSTPGIVEFTISEPALPVQLPEGSLPILGTLTTSG